MEQGMAEVVVLMVPLPAQGHLNQLLHLAVLLSARTIVVHFAAPASHNRQVQTRAHGWDPITISAIRFHDLPFPPVQCPPPDPYAVLKFPSHLQPLFDAAAIHLYDPLADLIRNLSGSARRVVVVHDSCMSFVAEVASTVPNGEAYAFHPISAFRSCLRILKSVSGEITLPDELKLELVCPSLPHIPISTCFTQEFLDFVLKERDNTKFDAGQLFNSCGPIEAKFLDMLQKLASDGGSRPWAVGPLNPIIGIDCPSRSSHPCMNWLDKQPAGSVVYVSFGTMSPLSEDQIEQLAVGLKRCNHRFLWVVREADSGDVFSGHGDSYRLPKGYDEEVKGKGLVVKDWAPQTEILAHKATGGFMSHCGWNSCVESLTAGVPIAAWPMASDQPWNAFLVTGVLEVGLPVRDWSRWDKLVTAEEIELAVNKLMGPDEGVEIRNRAHQLGASIRAAPRSDLDSFISHISR